MGPPNHAALLQGVQSGKPDYDAIWRAYYSQLVKAASRINKRIAEDAVQQAWLEVLERGLLNASTTNVPALLTTVAVRRAIDLARKDRRLEPTDTVIDEPDKLAADGFTRAERGIAADEVLAASWDQRQIFNRNEDQVFQYRYCSDHTQTETGSALNLTRERISQIEADVVKKLRAKLRVDRDLPPPTQS